jgi:TIR domain
VFAMLVALGLPMVGMVFDENVYMTAAKAAAVRDVVFITHAAPEDNEFAVWLAAKLAMAGYRVWVDKHRLHGGDDFWDEIDQVLRNDSIKQIVVFTQHVRKPGAKKEMAIGAIVANRLRDQKFMIPIRVDDVAFSDAPPEFVRGNILNAHPNWSDKKISSRRSS